MPTIHTRVWLEFVVVLVFVVTPVLAHAGVFGTLQSFFGTATQAASAVQVDTQSVVNDEYGFLRSVLSSDLEAARGGGELFINEGVLVANGPAGADEIATTGITNGEIRVHIVRQCTNDSCETISHIAELYGVTTNTILWANDITDATKIRPGDALIILPIAGVQHTVVSGDTIRSIAQKYDGDMDEILAYNQLGSADELKVGQEIVVPGGRIKTAPAATSRVAAAPSPVRTSGSVSASGGFVHPAPGTVRTQGLHGFNAVDYGGPIGTPIRAAAAGEVIVSRNSGWNGGYGNYIVIRHPNGVQTLYAHNHANLVGVGEYVQAGQQIATMGNTGRSTGPHLHFEVRGARNPF